MSATFYVYKHIFSNGTIYIGKGNGKRWKSNSNRNTYWNNLKNKYGEPKRQKIAENLTEEEALELEELIIKEALTSTIKVCNISTGGGGCTGYKHTEEHKKHISNVQKTLKNSTQFKQKASKKMSGENNPMYGKPSWCKGLTKETDERVKQAAEKLKGVPKSESTKQKISQAKKGNKVGPVNKELYTFYNLKTKQTVTTTVYDMKQHYGCTHHISSVVTKKRKKHNNWILK